VQQHGVSARVVTAKINRWLDRQSNTYAMRTDAVKVRVWVHKSRIAGLGLFAAQDIKQGTRILPYIGEKISKAESTRRLAQGNDYIFTFNERYDIDGKILRNTARFSNHSCDPNCAIEKTTRTIWLVALGL
jgi:SET domain-containing protein